jgi:hypothetical protein
MQTGRYIVESGPGVVQVRLDRRAAVWRCLGLLAIDLLLLGLAAPLGRRLAQTAASLAADPQAAGALLPGVDGGLLALGAAVGLCLAGVGLMGLLGEATTRAALGAVNGSVVCFDQRARLVLRDAAPWLQFSEIEALVGVYPARGQPRLALQHRLPAGGSRVTPLYPAASAAELDALLDLFQPIVGAPVQKTSGKPPASPSEEEEASQEASEEE